LALFVTGCVSVPGSVQPAPDTNEIGDVCKLIAQLRWEDHDADHVSETLARSLDVVIDAEQEHDCP
jgi:hypothetical protein